MSELFSDIKIVQDRFHIPIMYGNAEVQWVQLMEGYGWCSRQLSNFNGLWHD